MDEHILGGLKLSPDSTSERISLSEGESQAQFSLILFERGILRLQVWDNKRQLKADNFENSRAQYPFNKTETKAWLEDNGFKVTLNYDPIQLEITHRNKVIYADLKHRAYGFNNNGAIHYTEFDSDALHMGMGGKSAPVDLSNRSFSLSALDAMGYDAYRTDPLYQCIPFHITSRPESCVGMFSRSYSSGTWSIGHQIDAFWGPYCRFQQDYGALDIFILYGTRLEDVVRLLSQIVGKPRKVPRWALGYMASSMGLAESDNPPAHTEILKFISKCRELQFPCTAIFLSSGYTVSEQNGTRQVFTLNKRRFPHFGEFLSSLHTQSIRVIANVKPYLLCSHPAYANLEATGAFFKSNGSTARQRLWSSGAGRSDEGSWLDFTSQAAQQWWQNGIRRLKEAGIDGIWNDNNEFSLSSDHWNVSGEINSGASTNVGESGRFMHTDLMNQCTLDVMEEFGPKIPFLISRSVAYGSLKYISASWSGDNTTSWATLQGNNAMGINAGVCLMQVRVHLWLDMD